jgi:hypothetical protein
MNDDRKLEEAFSKAFPEFTSSRARAELADAIEASASETDSAAEHSCDDSDIFGDASGACQFYIGSQSSAAQPGSEAVDPIDTLNPAFRKSMGWSKRPGVDPTRVESFFVGMVRPYPEFVEGSTFRFVAVDPKLGRAQVIRDRAYIQDFWENQINIRPFSTDFLKSALPIFRTAERRDIARANQVHDAHGPSR